MKILRPNHRLTNSGGWDPAIYLFISPLGVLLRTTVPEGFYYCDNCCARAELLQECSVNQCWSPNYLLLIHNEMSTEVESKYLEMFIAMTSKSLVIFLLIPCIVCHKSISPLWIQKKDFKKLVLQNWYLVQIV